MWLTGCIICLVTFWLTGCVPYLTLASWLTGCVPYLTLPSWLTGCIVYLTLASWLTGCVPYLTLPSWLTGCIVYLVTFWLTGCCFSFSFLWGPWVHVKHLLSCARLPFTLCYLGTVLGTLYSALVVSCNKL